MFAILLRLASGVLLVVDEVTLNCSGDPDTACWTWQSVLERFLAPIGSTPGLLALALALFLVLSPPGSISMNVNFFATALCGLIGALGAVAVLNGFIGGGPSSATRIGFTLREGASAAILGGAAFWILKNFDKSR